jgi:hypothetical protein
MDVLRSTLQAIVLEKLSEGEVTREQLLDLTLGALDDVLAELTNNGTLWLQADTPNNSHLDRFGLT